MPKQKTIPELEAEIAAKERQLAQLQHKQQQLENRRSYYEKGDRRKRAHRLCQRREKNNVKRREEIDANAGIKNAGIPTAGCKPPVNCLPESRPGAR